MSLIYSVSDLVWNLIGLSLDLKQSEDIWYELEI